MHRVQTQHPDYTATAAVGATSQASGSASVERVIELVVDESEVKCSKGDCRGDCGGHGVDPFPCDCQSYHPGCRNK